MLKRRPDDPIEVRAGPILFARHFLLSQGRLAPYRGHCVLRGRACVTSRPSSRNGQSHLFCVWDSSGPRVESQSENAVSGIATRAFAAASRSAAWPSSIATIQRLTSRSRRSRRASNSASVSTKTLASRMRFSITGWVSTGIPRLSTDEPNEPSFGPEDLVLKPLDRVSRRANTAEGPNLGSL